MRTDGGARREGASGATFLPHAMKEKKRMALLAEVAPTLYVCAHVEVTGCQPGAAAVGVLRTDGEIATTDRQRKTENAALI